ncbi:MAG: hypothetical protein HN995_13665 [Candidatus Marinimicrobia bacterium]|jgi:hypothetical protein|nr:hypothetical protein [Candidatus Neomarinimicrobiota bacterium]MBT4295789.1 hypothetical protein [Candidatus Neomarinimicrobiota bacterium]MBT5235431.1 hypothetical protein [Candidatus Neomarinimicrobiota bacterium]MBT6217875.1 hypothetical protein [Candidatus Neomarinimicrobiota bacterium]MBT6555514.1 hypothetical protein [Candidatus Neomarinimicrobiota bacterium]
MFFEKNNSPGKIINLDYVISMNWDKKLSVEFVMANGQTVTWNYKNEDDLSEDLNLLADKLHEAGLYMSVDKDQE